MSKNPAIGLCYLTEKRTDWHKNAEIRYIASGNFKLPMPRYYRDKLFRNNPALAELEKDKYFRERLERRDDILRRQSRNGNQDPINTYYERMINNSNKFLNELREQKKLKNKNNYV